MSNLIPSLETFAKACLSNSILPPPSVTHALLGCVGCFFWQAVFCVDHVLMVGFFVICLRARLRRQRDWARWVSVHPVFEFICVNYPRAGMGLLYYGQNFLIYPSAFPAGARESAFTLCPLALCVD